MGAHREMLERLASGELRELLRFVGSTDVEELELELAGTRLYLKRRVEAAAASLEVETVQPEEATSNQKVLVLAERVGFFHYGAEGAQRPPRVGDTVSTGQVLGIIDSLSVPNPVQATTSGCLVEVLVEDGQPVEYGQPLFAIQPAEG